MSNKIQKFRQFTYSQAAKFVLDHNLNVGDKVQTLPTNCKVSEILFTNLEIFIDKQPRPGYRKHTFKDGSSISIDVTGINNGIVGAYSMKKLTPLEIEINKKETLYYDSLEEKRKEIKNEIFNYSK